MVTEQNDMRWSELTDLTAWLEEKLLLLNNTETMKIPNGFNRLGFSKEEAAAHRQFTKIAKELELAIFQDEAGNQWAVWQVDDEAPTIAMGSHLDTVHNGGGYDGVAGVLCALATIKVLKDRQYSPRKNIAIICFVSEESARFGVSTIGSKAITGILGKNELADLTDSSGITLKTAMEQFGINWDTIERAELPAGKLECFVELHIEQGVQVEENGADIGVVTGVACPVRLKVKAYGRANHTGTTPMNNRQDAFVAVAPLVSFVSEEAQKVNRLGVHSLVATVSTVNLEPNGMTVIPGEVELGIDIRSVDDNTKRKFAESIRVFCNELAANHHVRIEVSTLVDNDSVMLDPKIQEKLARTCNKLELHTYLMNSGAGHDVMNMAHKWPSGLVFIPCKDGISHQPDEYTSIENLEKGTKVLVAFITS